jgi:hypothetical protein
VGRTRTSRSCSRKERKQGTVGETPRVPKLETRRFDRRRTATRRQSSRPIYTIQILFLQYSHPHIMPPVMTSFPPQTTPSKYTELSNLTQRAFTNPAPKVPTTSTYLPTASPKLHLYPPTPPTNNPSTDGIRPLRPERIHLHPLQQILLAPPRIRSPYLLLRPPTPQTPARPKTTLAGPQRC